MFLSAVFLMWHGAILFHSGPALVGLEEWSVRLGCGVRCTFATKSINQRTALSIRVLTFQPFEYAFLRDALHVRANSLEVCLQIWRETLACSTNAKLVLQPTVLVCCDPRMREYTSST